MAAGLGLLALAPAVFWSMTLKELDAALRGRLGSCVLEGPPDSQTFAALMQNFPDQMPEVPHG
ncbi:MAG: phage tail assembly chaperone [Hyphomicrobium sp.]